MEQTERFSSERPATRGTTPTSAATALAVTLWYLGNQSAQRDIAERFNISQGHVSVIVCDVVDFLCTLSDSVIRWPTDAQMIGVEQEFQHMAQFPGVIGAIDGCHIHILAPEYCQNDYLDRNHTHSVNLMAVCDAGKKFTYCFAGYPGSVHDQRVFANSALGQAVETFSRQHFPSGHYHIVGDSAFQLHQQSACDVPYKDMGSLTVTQLNYNNKLSQTRRVVENAFGFLKGRFRRLKRLECKLARVPRNIIACCVPHNITVSDQQELEMLNDSECIAGKDAEATVFTSRPETNELQ